jgi:hypothetical protein
LVPLICALPALAQQQESDITAALAKIDGPDPIQRVLDTQAIFQSQNPLLLSLALEKALQSPDGRVREVALIYLTNVRKQFIVTITIPPDVAATLTTQQQAEINGMSPMIINVSSVDQSTLELKADTSSVGCCKDGAITQNGFTVLIGKYFNDLGILELNFRGAANGSVLGALNEGSLSFPASTPLP